MRDRHEVRRETRQTREDWRDYRRSHRSAFHRRAYRAPRGYSIRRVTIGYRLPRAFYGSSYVIGNPGYYRLPIAGRYREWVRYGNDMLLIDIRTGEVITIYEDFFW